jgi:hypothetical protein
MTNNRLLRLGLFFTALWLTSAISDPAYCQRVWALVDSDFYVNHIRFPTADTGYAAFDGSDSLLRTTDRGQSWNAVNLPLMHTWDNNFGSYLTFFGSFGWFMTSESDAANNIFARLLKTTDYGFTWSMLPMDSTWIPRNIYFKSPSLGYMMGNPFRISTDGGRSWQTRTAPPIYESSTVDEVGQPNVLLGTSWGSSEAVHYLSTDTGATWSRTDSIFHLISYGGMAYIGASTWISHNAWTTDNGQTWDTVPTTAQHWNGVMTTDTLGHGMFTRYPTGFGDFALYFTSDFGHSWDSAKVPFQTMEDGVTIGDVWYVLAYDSAGTTLSLYRSLSGSSIVSQTAPPPKFQILTNPATHFLQLSLEDTPDDIRIVDFLGRTVARYSTQGGECSADVSGFPEGLYWVVARSGALPFVHLAP